MELPVFVSSGSAEHSSLVPSTETPHRHLAYRGHSDVVTPRQMSRVDVMRAKVLYMEGADALEGRCLRGRFAGAKVLHVDRGRCPGADVRWKVLPLCIAAPSYDDDDKCIAPSVAVDHTSTKTTSTAIDSALLAMLERLPHPKIALFPGGPEQTPIVPGYCWHPTPHAKRHLDRSSRFCKISRRYMTDRHTDRPRHMSVAIGRIYMLRIYDAVNK